MGLCWLGWFFQADPPDRCTKNSWFFISPAWQLMPTGKYHCTMQLAQAPTRDHTAPGRWLPPCTPPVLPNVSTNEKSFYQKQLRNAWKKQLLKWSRVHLSETKTLQKLNTFSILITSKVNIFVIIWILDIWKRTQLLYLSFRLRLFILAGEFLSY